MPKKFSFAIRGVVTAENERSKAPSKIGDSSRVSHSAPDDAGESRFYAKIHMSVIMSHDNKVFQLRN